MKAIYPDAEALFERHADMPRRVFFRHFHHQIRNVHDREDTIQEGYLFLWRVCRTRKESVSEDSWRVIVAWTLKYVMYRAIQRTWRRRAVAEPMYDFQAANLPAPQGVPTADLLDLRAAMDALPNELRWVIEQIYVHGKTYPEIGAKLGHCKNTVAHWAKKAIGELGKLLGNEDAWQLYLDWLKEQRDREKRFQKRRAEQQPINLPELVRNFLDKRTVPQLGAEETYADLLAAFFDWAGLPRLGGCRELSQQLTARFDKRFNKRMSISYVGVRLVPNAAAAAAG